jgi:hypothetical protein
MKAELDALEARKEELQSTLEAAPKPLPRLHPNLAELYSRKVAKLHESLNDPQFRDEAAQVLRGLIEEIRLIPKNGRLEIELTGDLAALLALTKKGPRRNRAGVQITLVAGARNHRELTLSVMV